MSIIVSKIFFIAVFKNQNLIKIHKLHIMYVVFEAFIYWALTMSQVTQAFVINFHKKI